MTVETIRLGLCQDAPREGHVTTLKERKRELLEPGYIERLVMDGRTPIKLAKLGRVKFGGPDWKTFYQVPPKEFNENNQDNVERVFVSAGCLAFKFKDKPDPITSSIFDLTPEEEEIVKSRIEEGREKRDEWLRELHKWGHVYDGETVNV